jgi:hypothetical protein
LTPIYDDNECSYEALVTVTTRNKQRNTAIVLAEDISHGEVSFDGISLINEIPNDSYF